MCQPKFLVPSRSCTLTCLAPVFGMSCSRSSYAQCSRGMASRVSRVAVMVNMHTTRSCMRNVWPCLLLPRFELQPCRERVGDVDHPMDDCNLS